MNRLPEVRRLAGVYEAGVPIEQLRIDAKTRGLINRDLIKAGLDGNGRFNTVGLAHIAAADVLAKYGFEFSDTLSGYDTQGDQKHLTLYVSRRTSDPFTVYPISNTFMVLAYTKLGDRKYEVICYMS